jgi:hypothetical protein
VINIALLGGGDETVMAGADLARQGHRVTCVEWPAAAVMASTGLPVWSGASASGYLTFTRNPAILGRSQLIVVGLEAPGTGPDMARLVGCHLYSDARIVLTGPLLTDRDILHFSDIVATVLAYRDLSVDFSLVRQPLADLARRCPAPAVAGFGEPRLAPPPAATASWCSYPA